MALFSEYWRWLSVKMAPEVRFKELLLFTWTLTNANASAALCSDKVPVSLFPRTSQLDSASASTFCLRFEILNLQNDLHLSPSLSCPVDPLTSRSCLNFALSLWLPRLTWKPGPSSCCLVALSHGLLGPGFHSKVSWDWNQRTAKTTKNKNWRWMTYKTYMKGRKHPKIILTGWASAQNCSQFSIWGKYATREQRMREGSSGSHRLVAITVTGPASNTNNKSCKARSGTHTSKQNHILLFHWRTSSFETKMRTHSLRFPRHHWIFQFFHKNIARIANAVPVTLYSRVTM